MIDAKETFITPPFPLSTPTGTTVYIIGGSYARRMGTFLSLTPEKANVKIYLDNATLVRCLERRNLLVKDTVEGRKYSKHRKRLNQLIQNERWFALALAEICGRLSDIGIPPHDPALHEVIDLMLASDTANTDDSSTSSSTRVDY
jgi:hypothetical protein